MQIGSELPRRDARILRLKALELADYRGEIISANLVADHLQRDLRPGLGILLPETGQLDRVPTAEIDDEILVVLTDRQIGGIDPRADGENDRILGVDRVLAVACVEGNDGCCPVRIDVVIAGPGDDKRGAIVRVQVIVPGAGIHEGIAFPVLDIVGSIAAEENVVAGVAFDVVVAGACVHVVVARACVDLVIASKRLDRFAGIPSRKEISKLSTRGKGDPAQNLVGIPNGTVRKLDTVQRP